MNVDYYLGWFSGGGGEFFVVGDVGVDCVEEGFLGVFGGGVDCYY